MNFYEKLQKICADKHTSPSAVARKIGLSNSAATYWKKGSTPKAETLRQLAEALGVSEQELYSDKELREMRRISEAASEVVTKWQKDISSFSNRITNSANGLSNAITSTQKQFADAGASMRNFFTPDNIRDQYVEMITEIINTPPDGINLNQMCSLSDILQSLYLMNESGYSELLKYAKSIVNNPEFCRPIGKNDKNASK